MRKIVMIALTLLLVVCMSQSAIAEAKGEMLTAEEARVALKDLIPNVKVLSVGQAPIAGLWEVAIDSGGRKGIVYLDHAKKYLVSGNIHDIKTKANLTQESLQKITKVDASRIPLQDALVLGDRSAKNKVIVFSDPD